MNRLFLLLSLFSSVAFGYEIPKEASGMGELDQVLARARESGKPVAFVVAIKTQPET